MNWVPEHTGDGRCGGEVRFPTARELEPFGHHGQPGVDVEQREDDQAACTSRAGLGEHRLDRLLVADEGVALQIAGDPNRVEAMTQLGHRLEQLECPSESPDLLIHVAADHEDVAHADLIQPSEDSLQVPDVDQESC